MYRNFHCGERIQKSTDTLSGIRRTRVDDRCIRIKKFADTKISGYVWTTGTFLSIHAVIAGELVDY